MLDQTTTVKLNSPKICGYFTDLGYKIPTTSYQRFRKNGKPTGYRTRYVLGATLTVRTEHLSPGSHYRITYTCDSCGKRCSTLYNLYMSSPNEEDLCIICARSKSGLSNSIENLQTKRKSGVMGKNFWRKKLLHGSEDVCCDICGETDKRFLVIHHLTPRSKGGLEHRDNVVVLSANYHQAFHAECGGNDSVCTPEQYYAFRKRERNRLQNLKGKVSTALL